MIISNIAYIYYIILLLYYIILYYIISYYIIYIILYILYYIYYIYILYYIYFIYFYISTSFNCGLPKIPKSPMDTSARRSGLGLPQSWHQRSDGHFLPGARNIRWFPKSATQIRPKSSKSVF